MTDDYQREVRTSVLVCLSTDRSARASCSARSSALVYASRANRLAHRGHGELGSRPCPRTRGHQDLPRKIKTIRMSQSSPGTAPIKIKGLH